MHHLLSSESALDILYGVRYQHSKSFRQWRETNFRLVYGKGFKVKNSHFYGVNFKEDLSKKLEDLLGESESLSEMAKCSLGIEIKIIRLRKTDTPIETIEIYRYTETPLGAGIIHRLSNSDHKPVAVCSSIFILFYKCFMSVCLEPLRGRLGGSGALALITISHHFAFKANVSNNFEIFEQFPAFRFNFS